jgi:hypothetical protein
MAEEVTTDMADPVEIMVSPVQEDVADGPVDGPEWLAYEAALRAYTLKLITQALGGPPDGTSSVGLEVVELVVYRPLSAERASLRAGAVLDPDVAVELVADMAANRGPGAELRARGRVEIKPGWDGAIQFAVPSAVADVMGREPQPDPGVLAARQRPVLDEPEEYDDDELVKEPADDAFWQAVCHDLPSLTLVCERWAYGTYGYRWWRVATTADAEAVRREVRPRSLVRFVSGPDLTFSPDMLEESFTAFRAPLEPGELEYRNYPLGTDTIDEVLAVGFTLALLWRDLDDRQAVIPDTDGVIRALWER